MTATKGQSEYFLEMREIVKVYPNGVLANDKVNLCCQKGEIHALMGENGAGKSTLMKILFGVEKATEGKIFFKGEELNLKSPLDAIAKGIGMVHQHFMLDENLTVTENIILGIEPQKYGAMDYALARKQVLEVAEKYNLGIDPDKLIMDLDVGKKQKVEILKALIRGAEVLILDEPTAVLTPQETEELFSQLKLLRDQGHTILFISHKLKEIREICSKATVMRNGKYVGTRDLKDVTLQDLSRMMVGRDVVREVEKKEATPHGKVLEVKNLSLMNDDLKQVLKQVSFTVPYGKILGIAGVEGNGQRELIDCITGLNSDYQGEIFLQGQAYKKRETVRQVRDLGLFHIPEDRLTYGVMAEASIEDNLIANVFHKKEYNRGLLLDEKKLHALSDKLIQKYQVKTDSKFTEIRMLSGGNMQKVVAAREMSGEVKLLVADQPTRGIDIGTATFMYDQIVEMRDQGKAVLLVSADINEVLELSDSLMVMYEGEIVAYFENTHDLTEEELGLYMLGIKKMTEKEKGGLFV